MTEKSFEEDMAVLAGLEAKICDLNPILTLKSLKSIQERMEKEISDLENGMVLWMGLGDSFDKIQEKIELRKKVLKKVVAWKELFK